MPDWLLSSLILEYVFILKHAAPSKLNPADTIIGGKFVLYSVNRYTILNNSLNNIINTQHVYVACMHECMQAGRKVGRQAGREAGR